MFAMKGELIGLPSVSDDFLQSERRCFASFRTTVGISTHFTINVRLGYHKLSESCVPRMIKGVHKNSEKAFLRL
jgi:hypothetical protein